MSRTKFAPFGQNCQKDYLVAIQQSTDNVSVGAAAGNAATVALPAQAAGGTAQGSWVIGGVLWSYSAAVTSGRLTIADTSGNLTDIDIHTGTAQNFGQFLFQPPLSSQLQNSAVTVTLGGVGAVTGKVNVQAWLEF